MLYILLHMKTATLRKLRHDLGTVLQWVAAGEEVTILNRTKPVARMCPARPQPSAKVALPDFEARARAIFGDTTTHFVDHVLEERKESRW